MSNNQDLFFSPTCSMSELTLHIFQSWQNKTAILQTKILNCNDLFWHLCLFYISEYLHVQNMSKIVIVSIKLQEKIETLMRVLTGNTHTLYRWGTTVRVGVWHVFPPPALVVTVFLFHCACHDIDIPLVTCYYIKNYCSKIVLCLINLLVVW